MRKSDFSVNTNTQTLYYNPNGNKPKTKHGTNLARVRTSFDNLLGRNIFRQESEVNYPIGNRFTMTDLSQLIGKHGNPVQLPDGTCGYVDIPAMYCIAAEKRLLEDDAEIDITETNKSSLIFLVVWKDKDDKHHISHYFAEDAHNNLERKVSKLIDPIYRNPKALIPPGHIYRHVTSMKLSHHGASSSNPDEIFARFDAKNIIVSAGGQYGHPSESNLTSLSTQAR